MRRAVIELLLHKKSSRKFYTASNFTHVNMKNQKQRYWNTTIILFLLISCRTCSYQNFHCKTDFIYENLFLTYFACAIYRQKHSTRLTFYFYNTRSPQNLYYNQINVLIRHTFLLGFHRGQIIWPNKPAYPSGKVPIKSNRIK